MIGYKSEEELKKTNFETSLKDIMNFRENALLNQNSFNDQDNSWKEKFNDYFPKVMSKHTKFLDQIFDKLISHINPTDKFKYWDDLPKDYDTEYDVIQNQVRTNK